MFATVRALMSEAIDYAGLFPPAQLPLDTAIRDYARYRAEPDAWMLGRFICPVAKLAELGPYRELLSINPPFRFSVLGAGGKTTDDFLAGLRGELTAMHAFEETLAGLVRAEIIETKLPQPLYAEGDEDEVAGFFRAVSDVLLDAGRGATPVFFEVPLDATVGQRMPVITAAVEMYLDEVALEKASKGATRGLVGLKLRSGGVKADAIPTCEHLAAAISAGATALVPLKFTAGLHHPIRHANAGVGAKMHGFLNVFAAGMIGSYPKRGPAKLARILADENAKAFRFDEARLTWEDEHANAAWIAEMRTKVITSFGSCSFDEPREDLRGLGLL